MKKILPYLEQRILDDIIRPALTEIKTEDSGNGLTAFSNKQTLHFDILLQRIKGFYEANGGTEWNKVIKKVS